MLNTRQSLSLAFLRVTLGLLLFWWGVSKIIAPEKAVKISDKFYYGLFSDGTLQYYFGYVQIAVGLCVVVGFLKKFAVPAQLVITGGCSLAIWNALLDPFALYLPVDKLVPIQHFFYPSLIALAGTGVMLCFGKMDVYSLDAWLGRKSRVSNNADSSAPIAAE